MNVKDKIIEVSKLLDELDDFDEQMQDKMNYYNEKVFDLLHYLEHTKLDSKKCYRFCKETKSVLQGRREFKTNMLVYKNYKGQKERLNNGKDNRKLLLSSIGKEEKFIRNSVWKNRVYTEEELVEKIGEIL